MPRKKATKNLIRKDLSYKGKGVAKAKKKAQRKTTVPRTRNAGTWTEAMFFQKIRSSLRNGFRFWKPIMNALKEASRPYRGKNKRQKVEYKCNHCENWFPRTQVQVDHVIECGQLNCYEDIVPFIMRLTAENPEDYQVLCKCCHKIKTDAYKETIKKKAA